MFLNPRLKSHDLLFYDALEKRTELTKHENRRHAAALKGFEGECLYDEIFNDVGHDDVLVYRDLYLKIGESVTQYDALVIDDEGIVVNEIKNYTEITRWKAVTGTVPAGG
ncbi:nuclease-related domain-containing protein [Jeotgalicoccus sp. FSL K6-3177]|uniref:nuclease-related domain-containing protein n=1 Tax=Jeotgalicoccus sp. FSL K6-3177 TaxID=2921494 RepID=UPI0030FD8C21